MNFNIRYILAIGGGFIILGFYSLIDWFARDLDVQVAISSVTRLLTGSVFIVGAMGLSRLDEADRNKDG